MRFEPPFTLLLPTRGPLKGLVTISELAMAQDRTPRFLVEVKLSERAGRGLLILNGHNGIAC
jgi:hypothetical protein